MSLLLMVVVLPRATHHPGDYSETTLGSMLRQLRMQLELLNCFLMTRWQTMHFGVGSSNTQISRHVGHGHE